jgi:iron complex outermembrane recepter protein
MNLISRSIIYKTALFFILFYSSQLLFAQNGNIRGTVTEHDTDEPIPGTTLILEDTRFGTTSQMDGSFLLEKIPAGSYNIVVSFVGFETIRRNISIEPGETETINFSLKKTEFKLEGIVVSALRPDLTQESKVGQQDVKEALPIDSGQLLRIVPGVDAVRRGPIGFDPVVRGLRETEVGTYLDGTRIFPAGPARMDSPLSHLDPSNIESMEVVKGPYALTWGSGNLSAIRVKTKDLGKLQNNSMNASAGFGYQTNLDAFESIVSVAGRNDALAVWINGAWREGNDFDNGKNVRVPADFLSREIRGKIGYQVDKQSELIFGIGFQNQEDINYPGRLLDAESFDALNTSLTWKKQFFEGSLRSFEFQTYFNQVDHVMNNDEKPTAVAVPNRIPPFALDIKVDSEISIVGASAKFDVVSSNFWNFEFGADVYSANRDAVRFVRRRDNGMLIFEDQMWPDATITSGGLYTQATHSINENLSASATVRLDLVSADADRASDFFTENISDDLDHSEANLNAAFSISQVLNENWSVSLGAGTAVRTADVNERYSDRIPASKAQTSAEFVGNPNLDPERNSQLDLWIEANYPKLSFNSNFFVRRMDDYITLQPTGLPKRLPLSPDTVFQYVNGRANFWGVESSLAYLVLPVLTVKTSVDYLWGKDKFVGEPALGVAPLGFNAGIRYDSKDGKYFIESTLNITDRQDRVAAARGEKPTDGFETVDLKTGVELTDGLRFRFGIENLFDADYVNHLNANNPFAGIPIANFRDERIPEPGRVFSFNVEYNF